MFYIFSNQKGVACTDQHKSLGLYLKNIFSRCRSRFGFTFPIRIRLGLRWWACNEIKIAGDMLVNDWHMHTFKLRARVSMPDIGKHKEYMY